MATEITSRPSNTANSYSRWNPLRVGGTELPPNLLLMAKILVPCFLLTGQLGNLPNHFLPFLDVFDYAGPPLLFQRGLQIVFLIAAASLLFNYRVRTCCLLLGGVVLVGILSSRPYFENNRTFTGCLWFVTGLYVPGQKPWVVRWQVILLYFGAGLNKLLDSDWRSGQFFENMEAHLGRHRVLYIRISSWLPAMLLSKLMSWTVIVTEFALAGGFLIVGLFGLTAWIGIAYHTTLLVLTGSTFGMFYYATASSFISFVEWPRPPISVTGTQSNRTLLNFVQKLNLDGLFNVSAGPVRQSLDNGSRKARAWDGVQAVVGDSTYEGLSALYLIAIYNPLTYFAFAVILSSPFPAQMLFRRIRATIFLLFVSPALLAPIARRLQFRLVMPQAQAKGTCIIQQEAASN